mgnify:CR=1 FL=1
MPVSTPQIKIPPYFILDTIDVATVNSLSSAHVLAGCGVSLVDNFLGLCNNIPSQVWSSDRMSNTRYNEAQPAREYSRFRVLVVEDSDVTCRVLDKVFSDIGITQILWATQYDQGFDIFCKEKVDLVFIDWDIDDNKGLELAKKIKQGSVPINQHAKIILSVAFADRGRILEAVQAGFMNILAKPIVIESLRKQIFKALD